MKFIVSCDVEVTFLMKVFGRQNLFYLIGDFLSKFYAHRFFSEFPTGLHS